MPAADPSPEALAEARRLLGALPFQADDHLCYGTPVRIALALDAAEARGRARAIEEAAAVCDALSAQAGAGAPRSALASPFNAGGADGTAESARRIRALGGPR
mgnify:FL=1